MDELGFPVSDAIKAAGSNPLALVAFLMFLAAVVTIGLKVRRNKNLLASLEKLPAKDRLAALNAEMGTLAMKGSLTPEQWLRQNSRQYMLGALVVTCVTGVVLVVVILSSVHGPTPKTGVHIALDADDRVSQVLDPASNAATATGGSIKFAVSVSGSTGTPQMAEQAIPESRAVTYQSVLEGGAARITYSAPYFDVLAAGGPIEGFNILGVPFRWRFPELSVTVANNGNGVLVLSEARIEVLDSQALNDVILLVEDMSVDRLVFRNEGWGDVIQPRINYSVSDEHPADVVDLFAPKGIAVDMATFADAGEIAVTANLPDRLRNKNVVRVIGTIEYGPDKARKTVKFNTRISLQVRAAVGKPPTYTYDVLLNADQQHITRQVGLAQEIKPGESDRFLLRVASNRTARYRLSISFVTADGTVIKGEDATMNVFVPRTPIKIVLAKER